MAAKKARQRRMVQSSSSETNEASSMTVTAASHSTDAGVDDHSLAASDQRRAAVLRQSRELAEAVSRGDSHAILGDERLRNDPETHMMMAEVGVRWDQC